MTDNLKRCQAILEPRSYYFRQKETLTGSSRFWVYKQGDNKVIWRFDTDTEMLAFLLKTFDLDPNSGIQNKSVLSGYCGTILIRKANEERKKRQEESRGGTGIQNYRAMQESVSPKKPKYSQAEMEELRKDFELKEEFRKAINEENRPGRNFALYVFVIGLVCYALDHGNTGGTIVFWICNLVAFLIWVKHAQR